MDSNNGSINFEVFEELFDLDLRVEATSRSGRCDNPTNDGCSGSCASVGCSATCNCR